MAAVVVILIVLLALGLWYFAHHTRPRNFPPGPPRLPMVGNLLHLGNPPHAGLRALAKKYGKIYSIYCGNYPGIVLSDLNLIKEAFKDERFSARPLLRPFLERSWGHRKGLIFGSGDEWVEQRAFAVQVFKQLGLGAGRSVSENVIGDEVFFLIERLREEVGHPIALNRLFHVAIVNALWHLVAGFRFEYNDPKLEELIRFTADVVRFRSLDSDSFQPSILFFIPWITRWFPEQSGWNRFLASFRAIFPTLQGYIEGHEEGGDGGDLIDIYLQKIKETRSEGSSFFKENGEKSLMILLLDLFVAGGETASSNLVWGFLFLTHYPEVQAKIHAELEEVVGRERAPCLADKQRMPYLQAFINEVLRMVTIGAMSIFHSTSEDIPDFHGYSLPKDTIVFGNFWQVHHDPEIWGDPQHFRPERFLEPGAAALRENLRVFSTGRRVCPGESFARDELFMFTAGLLQVFSFEKVPGAQAPCLDPMQAATLRSHGSEVIIRLRQSIEN